MGILDWFIRREQPTVNPFHITIGSASTKAFDLQNDLRMLRSALAYAEKVKLCSTNMSHMYTLFSQSKDVKGFLAYLEKAISFSRSEQERQKMTQQLDWIKGELQKSYSQKKGLLEFIRRQVREQQRGFKRQYPTLTTEAEIKGITEAIRQGVLELHTFQALHGETLVRAFHAGETVPDETGISDSARGIIEEFLETVSSAFIEGATFPMFDDTTGQLVDAFLEEKGKTPSDIRMQRARHSALAGDLLERLPDFSQAPIDEIMDIRKELSEPLDRFRGGVSTYAASMKAIPWNKDFADEADEIFIQKVKPGVLEFEDLAMSRSGPLSHIWKQALKAKAYVGGGAAIGFFIDTPDSLPIYLRAALGAVLPLTFAAGEGIRSYKNERRKIKSHTLYFYCKLRDKFEQ